MARSSPRRKSQYQTHMKKYSGMFTGFGELPQELQHIIQRYIIIRKMNDEREEQTRRDLLIEKKYLEYNQKKLTESWKGELERQADPIILSVQSKRENYEHPNINQSNIHFSFFPERLRRGLRREDRRLWNLQSRLDAIDYALENNEYCPPLDPKLKLIDINQVKYLEEKWAIFGNTSLGRYLDNIDY